MLPPADMPFSSLSLSPDPSFFPRISRTSRLFLTGQTIRIIRPLIRTTWGNSRKTSVPRTLSLGPDPTCTRATQTQLSAAYLTRQKVRDKKVPLPLPLPLLEHPLYFPVFHTNQYPVFLKALLQTDPRPRPPCPPSQSLQAAFSI